MQEAREELSTLERELNMKSSQARDQDGAQLIRGDEVEDTHAHVHTHTHTHTHRHRHSYIHTH